MAITRRDMLHGSLLAGIAVVVGGQWLIGEEADAAGFPYALTDAEWRRKLTATQYRILRRSDTEYPNSSPLAAEHRKGTFLCAGCGQKLYSSSTKFESGTGWPSFWRPLPRAVAERTDPDGERREVLCARCGGHLGHVFDDGPRPTGLRYCMNGGAMRFVPG